MNETRKLVLNVAAMAGIFLAVYPPWTGNTYGWLWEPPSTSAMPDFARLFLEFVAMALFTVILLFGGDKPKAVEPVTPTPAFGPGPEA